MFASTNKLDFLSGPAPRRAQRMDGWKGFQIGTCHGLWRSTKKSYQILVVANREMGNGHFQDVIDWFENSCQRDGRSLMFLEIFNDDFSKHLVDKRGFTVVGDDAIKTFTK